LEGPWIDDLNRYFFLREDLSRFKRYPHRATHRDKGDIATRSLDIGLADRYEEVAVCGYVLLERPQLHVFKQHHGIVIAYSGLEEPFDIRRSRWTDDLQSRHIHEQRIRPIGVLGGNRSPVEHTDPKHDGNRNLPGGHEAQLRGLIDDLVRGEI